MNNKYIIISAVFIAVLMIMYSIFMSPTDIAFINFKDFQIARISGYNDNHFINVERIPYKKGEVLPDLGDYDAVYIFGMGVNFSNGQREQLKKAMASGVRIYVQNASEKDSDLTNITGIDYDHVSGYLKHRGKKNYRALLNYTRRVFDGKKLFTEEITPPGEVPADYYFYPGVDEYFTSYESYLGFYKKKDYYNGNAPRVAIVVSNVTPQNSSQAHVKALAEALQRRGINVFPVSGIGKRLEFLKEIDPQLIVYFPHGKFSFGRGDEILPFLEEKHIPVLAPLFVFENRHDWEKDQKGMQGGMLTQSVVTPELDGCIQPYVISAQEKGETGLNEFVPIENRIEKFSGLIKKWLDLKSKRNSDKKIAIYYYKGPGLNSMTAAGMEVVPSLYNLLVHLKKSGYDTGELPVSAAELEKLIQKKGKVPGPYASGTIREYLREGSPELVEVDTYRGWLEKDLEADMVSEVEKTYGPPPGEYMSMEKDGRKYIAVARIRFGNVVLLPQPLPAVGDNGFRLIHGAKQAPPHPYIASYMWARNGFGADAIIHFGTHGSLEFTPWKQVALSQRDWPDALMGGMPHVYVYVINNVGEAVIAKRRSYAVINSHLTPPFDRADIYGGIKKIRNKIDQYSLTDSNALKEAYAASIKKLVLEMKLDSDLGISGLEGKKLSEDDIEGIEEFINVLENEKITRGLYTLGVPYSESRIVETVRTMMIDPVAFSMADMDRHRGIVTRGQVDDPVFFNARYRKRAYAVIDSILSGGSSPGAYIDRVDLNRLDNWDRSHRKPTEKELLDIFMSFSKSSKISGGDLEVRDSYEKRLHEAQDILLRALPYKEKENYLRKLSDEKAFKKSSDMLDPEKRKKAGKLAALIPEMGKTLKTASDPDMLRIVSLMQDEKLKKDVFRFMDDRETMGRVLKEKERVKNGLLVKSLLPGRKADLFAVFQKKAGVKNYISSWDRKRTNDFISNLSFYLENRDLSDDLEKKGAPDSMALAAILGSDKSMDEVKALMGEATLRIAELDRIEKEYVEAVRTLKESLDTIKKRYHDLKISSSAELYAVTTALNGGYIRPSSGGDAVFNPEALPTGRNLYSIDAEKAPSPEAWETGKKLGEALLKTYMEKNGKYPVKVAFTLWGGEFIRSQGITLAEIFYLLGVEPVRNSGGDVHDVKLIPAEKLKRPRIDVVVQTSGQFRDIATSRMYLIDRAVKLAADAGDPDEYRNYVKEGNIAAEKEMKRKGLSPREARELSGARIFGGVNGSYGTGIMGLVEKGNAWEKDSEISAQYLKNMGAVYTEQKWGVFKPGVFEGALQNTEAVVQPSSSNMSGALSLDHVYEFMGGLNAAVRNVTGKDPDAYFNDMRNSHNPRIRGLKESIALESRATLLNPKYIKDLLAGGASSAEEFAEAFRNTYGWNVMKPSVIDRELWENLYATYIRDENNLGIRKFFKDSNPYSLQEITAVMLETVRKGYWKPSEAVIRELARLHAELVRDHRAGCSGFVCDNPELRKMIAGKIDGQLEKEYSKKIDEALTGQSENQEGMKLIKETGNLKSVKALVSSKKFLVPVMLLVLLMALTVIYGVMRKRRGEA